MNTQEINPAWIVRQASWDEDEDKHPLKHIRTEVFILEQKVPVELEWDDDDTTAIHLLAFDAHHHAIGTVRLLASGKIGRMAVLKAWRKQGVGSMLLNAALEKIQQEKLPTPHLDAQLQAQSFYASFGFHAHGSTFMDAGIPHRKMVLHEDSSAVTLVKP